MNARRGSFVDVPVTYGAVGATQRADLLYYPPQGYKPLERSVRLGSGDERFETSKAALMGWGVQRGAGFEVTDIDAGTGEQYGGIRYDAEGKPVALRRRAEPEPIVDENGDPRVVNGMSAVLRAKIGPFRIDAPVRVVYVIDEPRRAGFAYGTLQGHPESGEEAFILEHRDDDGVWLIVRAFSRPATIASRLGSPINRALQNNYTARYLRALHPAGQA